MRYRTFGRLGWPVSEIGYGMWGLAGWTGSDDASTAVALQHAVDLGVTFFDTAWAYGEGRSEQMLGRLVGSSAEPVAAAVWAADLGDGAAASRQLLEGCPAGFTDELV